MPAPILEVLLATYNGAAYVREQIDSILAQSYGAVRILARDDGSNDGTVAILAEYETAFPERFRVLMDGVKSGSPQGNFGRLLLASSGEYVAFADQDDVWMEDKLQLSMEAMQRLEAGAGRDKACMVFTDVRVVDENLKQLEASFWAMQRAKPELAHSFKRLLLQNVATGSTMLINRQLVELAGVVPVASAMHDWWIALAASSMGEIAIVPRATVLYRQHGANALGASKPDKTVRLTQEQKHAERRRYWATVVLQAGTFLDRYETVLPAKSRLTLHRCLRANRGSTAVVRMGWLLRNGYYGGNVRTTMGMYRYLLDGWRGPSDERDAA